MSSHSVDIVLEAFAAVERRDERALESLYHPDVSFHWPPSLVAVALGRSFEKLWDPLQPTEAERRMSPRVVAASDGNVVVLWRQRGVRQDGQRIDSEVLGFYEVRDGRFARAQMFYFDTVEVLGFLDGADEDR